MVKTTLPTMQLLLIQPKLREATCPLPLTLSWSAAFLHLDLLATSPVTRLTYLLTHSLRFPLPLLSFYHLRSSDVLGWRCAALRSQLDDGYSYDCVSCTRAFLVLCSFPPQAHMHVHTRTYTHVSTLLPQSPTTSTLLRLLQSKRRKI